MIRVLICDDQAVVTEGLRAILGTDPGIEIVGVAHDGAEALELVPDVKPEVVLMDLKMPGMNGVNATRRIRETYPEVQVLVLTTYDIDEWVFDAIRSGASGYLLKDTPRDALIEAVKGTAAGKTYVDPVVAGKLFEQVTQSAVPPDTGMVNELSEREREILGLIGRGLSNRDIAEELHLSEGTVRNYVSSIFAKLDVADRTQAAVLALRYGVS
jgi:DNA-binding NarL/FixJ family response regulator